MSRRNAMTSLPHVVPGILDEARRRVRPGAPPGASAPPSCTTCGGAEYVDNGVSDPADPGFGGMMLCPSCGQGVVEKRVARVTKGTSMERQKDKTFARFIARADQRIAYEQARRFARDPKGLLVLTGSTGTGKSHLCAATVLDVAQNLNSRVGVPLYYTAQEMLSGIKRAMRANSKSRDEGGLDADDLIDVLKEVGLLVIDEWGRQHATDWAQETLFDILGARYDAGRATMIATNLRLRDFEAALQSRLCDTESSVVVVMRGVDARLERKTIPAAPQEPSYDEEALVTEYHDLHEGGRAVVCPLCNCRPCWGGCPRVAPPPDWGALTACEECGMPVGALHAPDCSLFPGLVA